MASQQSGLTHAQLRTPRAAAVAGILFSVLLLIVYWLMRISVLGSISVMNVALFPPVVFLPVHCAGRSLPH